jgi:hypothetical protein
MPKGRLARPSISAYGESAASNIDALRIGRQQTTAGRRAPVPRQSDVTGFTGFMTRGSSANLHDWSNEVRSKVARAVAAGRLDTARCAELHRLLSEPLEAGRRHETDAGEADQVDARAST